MLKSHPLTYASSELPKLQIQPNGGVVTLRLGQKFALTCKPNVQDPTLITQFEWRDPANRRIELTSRASLLYTQPAVGEPGLMLIFAGLTANQAGNYTCSASYSNTEFIQATAVVHAFEKITFIDAPESQYALAGKKFLIKCQVQGNPTPLVEWLKNDNLIVTNDRYVVQNDGLLITNIKESDDGVYKCTAFVTATGEIDSRNIKVEVTIPPKIEPLKEIYVIEGETATIQCIATGKPPPTFSWIKENSRENLSISDRFDVKQNTGHLIITRVEFYDDSNYKCVAKNPAGMSEITTKINVLVKPKIYELLNVTAPILNETKITCKVQGRPLPRVMFRKFSNKEPFTGGQQSNDHRIITEYFNDVPKSETYATLIITNLTRSDDGLYECMAENSAGVAYKNGHIAVEFPPTFERTKNLTTAWSWGIYPGNLTCLPEAIPNATVVWYYNGRPIENGHGMNFKVINRPPQSNLIVNTNNDRRFFTNYECRATNKLGFQSLYIRLNEAKIPGMLPQIKVHSLTATTIKFDLVPPTYFDGLPLKTFVVQYKLENQIIWDQARNHTWSFGAAYILENLRPEATYNFRFAATNAVGIGPYTNGPSITMPRRSEPAEPKIITSNHKIVDDNSSYREIIVVSPYANHYELRWSVPSDNGDPIDSYLIRYCVTEKINGEWRDSDCSEEIRQPVQYTTYELNDLRADTTYKIELRANNAIGASSPAQIRVKTARGFDDPTPTHETSITSSAIIGIVVGSVILVLLVVDIACFCVNRSGILATICNQARSKDHEEEDPKLGSLYSWRFPLPYCSYKAAPAHPNSLNLPLPVKLAPSPMEEREPLKSDNSHSFNGSEKTMSVEFDGSRVYSKSGEIIGKHSAV